MYVCTSVQCPNNLEACILEFVSLQIYVYKCQVTALMGHHTILSPLLFQPSLISLSLLLLWVDAGAPTVWVPVQSFQRTVKSMEKQMVCKFEQANISLGHCTIHSTLDWDI